MVKHRRIYENSLSFILGNAEEWFNNNCCRDCYDNRVDYRDDLEAMADMADTNSVNDCMRYLISTGFSASSVSSAKGDIIRLFADLAQDALDEDPGDDYDEFEIGDDRSYDELDDDDNYDESYIRKLESRITRLERSILS